MRDRVVTPPPIGKAPNDGGGDLERARDLAKTLELAHHLKDSRAVLALVRRVEGYEKSFQNMLENLNFLTDTKDRVLKERDSLKSKLSEAEEALERIAKRQESEPERQGDCCYGNYDDAHRHGRDLADWECGQIAREALSRLRADGEGRENQRRSLCSCESCKRGNYGQCEW